MFNFDEVPNLKGIEDSTEDIDLSGIELDNATGQMTSVETLDDSNVDEPNIGTEDLDIHPAPATPAMGRGRPVPEKKPIPPRCYPHGESMVYHLAGDIEYTVIVLVAALGLARKGTKIAVELHAPYTDEAGLATVASAIEASDATVSVHLGQCTATGEAMIAMSADELSVGSGTWIIEPLRFWTRGSSNTCIDSAEQHAQYCDYVYSVFKDRGLLTEEELEQMNEFTSTIFLDAEEVKARLKLNQA